MGHTAQELATSVETNSGGPVSGQLANGQVSSMNSGQTKEDLTGETPQLVVSNSVIWLSARVLAAPHGRLDPTERSRSRRRRRCCCCRGSRQHVRGTDVRSASGTIGPRAPWPSTSSSWL